MSHNSKRGERGKNEQRKALKSNTTKKFLTYMTTKVSHHTDFGIRRKGPTVLSSGTNSLSPPTPTPNHSSFKVQAPTQSATSASQSSNLTDLSHTLPRTKRSFSIRKPTLQSALVLLPNSHHDPQKANSSTPEAAGHLLPPFPARVGLFLTQGS